MTSTESRKKYTSLKLLEHELKVLFYKGINGFQKKQDNHKCQKEEN